MATDTATLEPPTDTTTARSSPPTEGTTMRWRSLVGILIAAVWIIAQASLWILFDDSTQQIMYTYYVSPPFGFALLMWWLFFPGPSRPPKVLRRRWIKRATFAIALFFVVFRHDGFRGDLLPMFSLRFTTSPRDKARQYWANRETPAPSPVVKAVALDNPFVVSDDDWPQFRGPWRDGIVRDESVRTNWDELAPEPLWRHPVGLGWSSFSVIGDRMWTQELRDDDECVVCYDANTGEEIWLHSDEAPFSTDMGGTGPAQRRQFMTRVCILWAPPAF